MSASNRTIDPHSVMNLYIDDQVDILFVQLGKFFPTQKAIWKRVVRICAKDAFPSGLNYYLSIQEIEKNF